MQLLLKVILAPVFFIIVTPVAVVLRLLKIDLIDKSLNQNYNSYWQAVESDNHTDSTQSPKHSE